MTDGELVDSGTCEFCGEPATVRLVLFKLVKKGKRVVKLTTGKGLYVCCKDFAKGVVRQEEYERAGKQGKDSSEQSNKDSKGGRKGV